MDRRISQIAKELGARHVGAVPNVGGGAFGMARLAALLQERLSPGIGKRPGRPTNATWTTQRKVPMSAATLSALNDLSVALSSEQRKVSPMQLAAQLLEECVECMSSTKAPAKSKVRGRKTNSETTAR